MIGTTAALAVLFGLIALTRRDSGAAIGVLIFSMMIWPEYLRFPLGLFEVSIPRLVALLLLFKAVACGKHKMVSSSRVDTLIIALWAWTTVATVIAGASFSLVSQMIGRGLDTVLMYFVVRYHIKSSDDLKAMAWWLGLTTVVMGVLGAVEAFTGTSPYSGMTDLRQWHWIDKENEYRLGLLRAKASTSVHIYFGMAMMLITGILWSIQKQLPRSRTGLLSLVLGVVAALSSMSSGPWIACVMMFGLGIYSCRPRLIKPTLFMIAGAAVFLEVASNRHFYNLIDYLALDPRTAWYRTRLLEIAVSRLSEYGLVGVGGNWPEHWAVLLDGRNHIDVVNHFLIIALYGGLPALFMYVSTHALALSRAALLWTSSDTGKLRLTAFHLGAVLVALDISSMSVGLYGPPLLLSYILLGIMMSTTQAQPLTSKDAAGRVEPSDHVIGPVKGG